MSEARIFGTPKSADSLEFVANYQGPLHLLNKVRDDLALAATHEDVNALLGLTKSAQVLSVDTSVEPNQVSGTASFFSANGEDAVFSTFNGIAPSRAEGQEFQEAFVFVIFTGGTGKFQGATGTATVEAQLFPEQAMSKGTIRGTVIIPNVAGK